MATHSSILAWRIPGTEEPGGLPSMVPTGSDTTEATYQQQKQQQQQGWDCLVPETENLPTMQETWVQSLGQEDPLEKRMATHSSILAWRIPGTEEHSGLPSMGSHRVGHD